MNKEYFQELKTKVSNFVQSNTKESILIGGAALLVIGYIGYKLFGRSTVEEAEQAETVKELNVSGNIEETKEETKNQKPVVTFQTDSEDEPMLLRQSIKPKRDTAGILDRETIIKIFDKRSTIRGIRKLDRTFKDKRRAAFNDISEYKSIISKYHFEIERKRENNLEYICRSLGISIDDIENSQEKYFGDQNLAFVVGTKEFERIEVPTWLTLDKALEIYDEIKDMLQAELIQLNSRSLGSFQDKPGMSGEEARELEMVYIQYKMQDMLFNKYKIEEEHVKKVLFENGVQ